MTPSGNIDLDLIMVQRTSMAVLVKDAEDADPVWLPLSEIDLEHDPEPGEQCIIQVPEWLALREGLI